MRQPYTKYMRFGWKMQETQLMLSDVRTQLDHAISRDKANNPECQRANEEGKVTAVSTSFYLDSC